MHRFFPAGLALALASCSTTGGGGVSSRLTPSHRAQNAIEEAVIQGALEQVEAAKSDYRIGPGDLLDITVFQQSDLDRKLRVSQVGAVSFPLIGTVKVGGLTLHQAEAAFSEKLKQYLVSPQLTVFIKEYGNKKIFVLGEVKQPGSFDLPPESKFTVLEAVSLAGGFSPIAAPDRTKVIRTLNGKNQSITIPVSDITRRGEKSKDIPLEPNDVVYVPQSFF